MTEEEMLMCLIAFILGYLVARMMGNRIDNGFAVGAGSNADTCELIESISLEGINAACAKNVSAVTCEAVKLDGLPKLCHWDVYEPPVTKDELCALNLSKKIIPLYGDNYNNETLVNTNCNTICNRSMGKTCGDSVIAGGDSTNCSSEEINNIYSCKKGCKSLKSRPIIVQAKGRVEGDSVTYKVDNDDIDGARRFCTNSCNNIQTQQTSTGGASFIPDACNGGCYEMASQFKYMDVDCDAADTASGATA